MSRRFQFSLRWLMLASTAFCVWLGVLVNRAHRQRDAVAVFRMYEARVHYEPSRADQVPEVAWLYPLLGEDLFSSVTHVDFGMATFLPDSQAKNLACCSAMRFLNLRGTAITDDGLGVLRSIPNLETLWLPNGIQGNGLANLIRNPKLTALDASYTQITEDGLREIGRLRQIRRLSLRSTMTADAGVEHLKGLANLEEIDLRDTHVTLDGLTRLEQALPQCEVLY